MANNFPTIKPSLNLQLARSGMLPPDVTFTRASSSGGYYDGKTVAKAEENLLRFSQEFDNAAFGKTNTTVTANTTVAPDGTTTADTLTLNSADNASFTFQAIVAVNGATYTVSVFVKAGTSAQIMLQSNLLTTGANIVVDPSTGSIISSAGIVAASDFSVAAAEGFYRIGFSVVANTASSTTAAMLRGVTGQTLAGDTVIAWGAQVEQRDAVTAYTPTTTQPITRFQPKLEYAIANEPVFDHNPVTGEALGLSIFEARTNLFLRSEEFDNAVWAKTNATVSANQIIAPDGTLTADKLIANTANSEHLCRQTLTRSATTHTLFVYAKAAERSFIVLTGVSFATAKASFNLSAGTVGTVSGSGSPVASISSAGNGWFRCVLRFTASASSASYGIALANGNDSTFFTGDNFSGVFTWGAQLEAAPFATPYIPTVGSTVTRSADAAVMTGANFTRFYRADEGSFVAEAVPFSTAVGNQVVVDASAGASTANQITLLRSATNAITDPGALVRTNAVLQATLGQAAGTWLLGVSGKLAASYKTNDFAESFNGSAALTDTSVILPVVDRLTVGSFGTGTSIFNGYIKSLQYYPARLTNDNLVAVTA